MLEKEDIDGNKIVSDALDVIVPYFKDYYGIKILDIGCGHGWLLSDLYNKLSSKIINMIGVDAEVFDKGCPVKLEIFNGEFEEEHNGMLDSEEIPEGVVQMIREDGPTFLKELNEKQDLVIMSNLLHFFNSKDRVEIVKAALNKLTDRGRIFISVRSEYDDEPPPYPMTIAEVHSFNNFANIIEFNQTDSHFDFLLEKNLKNIL